VKQRVIVATRNAHKVEEIRAILGDFEVLDLGSIQDPPEVEETGTTFVENATLKAVAISELTDALVLSDDSGLEVDALGGEPGVYSSRYAGEDGNDALNTAKLLREMSGKKDRDARFRCVICLARNGKPLANFSGGYEQTFAELGEDVKNGMSHRSRALEGVVAWLTSQK